jgi:hypothetical protein
VKLLFRFTWSVRFVPFLAGRGVVFDAHGVAEKPLLLGAHTVRIKRDRWIVDYFGELHESLCLPVCQRRDQ